MHRTVSSAAKDYLDRNVQVSMALRVRNSEIDNKRMLTHRRRNSARSQDEVPRSGERGLRTGCHFSWKRAAVARRGGERDGSWTLSVTGSPGREGSGTGWAGSPLPAGPRQSDPGKCSLLMAMIGSWSGRRSCAWLGDWLPWMAPLWRRGLVDTAELIDHCLV